MIPTPRIGYAPRGGGAHIGYSVLGEGPALVGFVGGMVTSAGLFDEPRCARMHRELATYTTRVSLDRRGLGYSDPLAPGEEPTLERQVGDILCVLDALEIEQATLWANSWDAQATVLAAAIHPERVSRLIITSMTPCPAHLPDWPWGVATHVLTALDAEFDHPGAGFGPQDIPMLLAPSCVDDAGLWSWIDTAGRASPTVARAYMEVAAAADIRPVLPLVQAPTLILHSSGDRWTPVEGARYLAEQIPQARLVEYDSADNIIFTAHLEEKLAEIEAFVSGPAQAHAQRRLLTVLFTDVVGSTQRLAGTPDLRWTALLDEIDSTVARQVRLHSGRVCKNLGDGHLALFERPSDAVAAALAIGRVLRTMGVEIRAGAHIGEVELRGDDVAGVAVHVGARVSGKAGAGEVLVTRTVADLLAGSAYGAEPAGEHELKGLPGSWSLLRIVGA